MIPEEPEGWFYASQLVEWRGTWHLLGTEGRGAQSGLSDPLPVTGDETGIRVVKLVPGVGSIRR